ncbi:MAG TPA: DNA-binding response regulator [Clostridiales bacterium]|nr:MAG: DNA-binding response regulator [Clostridiales bacterium GWD2_32_19]HCC07521.1 DNA-binding response regulator [Clostridiales bacterium]
MSTKTILIADDNEEIVDLIIPHLVKDGFMPIIANDGEKAIELFEKENPILILLDIMMPKLDGLAVCKYIRAKSDVPIIMITAKSSDEDMIMGIDIGADDYIIKPFSPKQVLAKIKALLRRLDIPLKDDKIIKFGNLEINMNEYKVKLDTKEIIFTKKEVEILFTLASNPSQVQSREMLLNELWGYEYFGDTRNVDTHIKRIRAKLGLTEENNYIWDIKTVWGVGYKFEIENH